jgi:hypothetical protein
MIYKGFKIRREIIGKFGTTYRYKCGKFIAPRKKDIISHIDLLLDKKLMLELEFKQLEKWED